MTKKIIIINGHPAAGKTTFAMQLSQELKIPYMAKNTFKNALCNSMTISCIDESSRLSAITFDAIAYVAERMMEVGQSFIIEGSFAPDGSRKADEAMLLKSLINRYDFQPLTFIFTGDTQILHKRFLEREKLNERGANALFYEMTYDYFVEICRDLETFYIGGIKINVDTTDFDKVNFLNHIKTAKDFLE